MVYLYLEFVILVSLIIDLYEQSHNADKISESLPSSEHPNSATWLPRKELKQRKWFVDLVVKGSKLFTLLQLLSLSFSGERCLVSQRLERIKTEQLTHTAERPSVAHENNWPLTEITHFSSKRGIWFNLLQSTPYNWLKPFFLLKVYSGMSFSNKSCLI